MYNTVEFVSLQATGIELSLYNNFRFAMQYFLCLYDKAAVQKQSKTVDAICTL